MALTKLGNFNKIITAIFSLEEIVENGYTNEENYYTGDIVRLPITDNDGNVITM